MNVSAVWEHSRGIPECLIGIAEGDVDASHPELRNQIQEIYRLPGMTFAFKDHAKSHGTGVAGLIIAEDGNGFGIKGLSPGCHVIMALYGRPKTRMQSQRLRDELMSKKASQAMRFLVDKGCKVINCSFVSSPDMSEAFEYAVDNDVVVVISSGNSDCEMDFSYLPDEVLIVGAIGMDGRRWRETFTEIGRGKKGPTTASKSMSLRLQET
ncbi:MAG TPA: hypothetical protein EYQ50_11055 [Verrucomicrobiales bacterium]|nr:hypothetical protein [Verrucomicrobiales bacterium]